MSNERTKLQNGSTVYVASPTSEHNGKRATVTGDRGNLIYVAIPGVEHEHAYDPSNIIPIAGPGAEESPRVAARYAKGHRVTVSTGVLLHGGDTGTVSAVIDTEHGYEYQVQFGDGPSTLRFSERFLRPAAPDLQTLTVPKIDVSHLTASVSTKPDNVVQSDEWINPKDPFAVAEALTQRAVKDATEYMKRVDEQETRSVSSTGAEKGVKDARFSLIPTGALERVAKHYGVGAKKYAEHNWRKGYEWSKSYDALQRHANAWQGGEDIDEETGSHHMAAVAFHALTLLTFAEEQPEFDDRYKGDTNA